MEDTGLSQGSSKSLPVPVGPLDPALPQPPLMETGEAGPPSKMTSTSKLPKGTDGSMMPIQGFAGAPGETYLHVQPQKRSDADPFDRYSFEYSTNTKYLMFKLMNSCCFFVNCFCNYRQISKFDTCNTFPTQLEQGHVYHCVTSLFLLTLSKCVGTEGTDVMKVKFF